MTLTVAVNNLHLAREAINNANGDINIAADNLLNNFIDNADNNSPPLAGSASDDVAALLAAFPDLRICKKCGNGIEKSRGFVFRHIF